MVRGVVVGGRLIAGLGLGVVLDVVVEGGLVAGGLVASVTEPLLK